jgi:hypothetical protein
MSSRQFGRGVACASDSDFSDCQVVIIFSLSDSASHSCRIDVSRQYRLRDLLIPHGCEVVLGIYWQPVEQNDSCIPGSLKHHSRVCLAKNFNNVYKQHIPLP